MTTANPVQAVFSNLGTQLLSDAKGDLKGALLTFATNIKATPTTQNVAAQGAQLGVALLLSGPTLESEGIGQAATAIESLVNSLL